jgi:hypothetical protein
LWGKGWEVEGHKIDQEKIVCLFLAALGFELILARQAVLLLEPLHQLIFGVGFLGIGSQELFAQG